MNYAFFLFTAVASAILVDRQQPAKQPVPTQSAGVASKGEPYQVTFNIPANTRIEGDLILDINVKDKPSPARESVEIQVYDSFAKRNLNIRISNLHKSDTRISTFELVGSPQPKQVVVTFIELPSQELPDCAVVDVPAKRILNLPAGHQYAEASVTVHCKDQASTEPNQTRSSTLNAKVRFRRHPLD